MQVWDKTANQEYHFGEPYKLAQLEAVGFQWPDIIPRDKRHSGMYKNMQPRFNGGVSAPYESRLQKGDKLFRFAGSNTQFDRHMRGCWWFDEETCVFLWSKSSYKNQDENFRNAARQAFSVLDEWGDMGNLVSVVLKQDYWCFKGSSAPAKESKGPVVVHNPFGVDVMQIFIPGGLPEEVGHARRAALDRLVY